ncbi:hypothetical protein [Pseudarthrobacter sp. NIBRBAC000502770]|uniref:hypothetical protein n=1 Tax=Pseudarthrobacter sp. NIBRBAC000502770 TaxID=2590785 RepID=UPI00113FFB4E|nr:hypothetical protein [Pseudarthrobacter sp. NIBRBAC000502770]QDG90140.1 hypothetical protein NIBR502770_17795 [Pseudarthrobacter sp. NIBRBAC000502770]
MTSQGQRHRGWFVVRTIIMSLGLSALAALSYHSATAPAPAPEAHELHYAVALAADPQQLPANTQTGGSAAALPQLVPSLPAPAGVTVPRPGPADPADPANRQQASLQGAADKEHAVVGPGQEAPPLAPAPVARGPVTSSQVFQLGAENAAGCLKEYGDNGQCVPAVPPSLAQHLQEMTKAGGNPAAMPHQWSCTELRQYFHDGVTVRQAGIDPQKLDSNGDGKACGLGDSGPK